MRITLVVAAGLAACSASPAPKGWTPMHASTNAWSHGDRAGLQEYSYSRMPFSGQLPDLASRVAVDVLLGYHGAKLRGSSPFSPCPGAAGVATFSLGGGTTLEEGFAVRDGVAVRTRYFRPSGAQPDPDVTAAMQTVLC